MIGEDWRRLGGLEDRKRIGGECEEDWIIFGRKFEEDLRRIGGGTAQHTKTTPTVFE